MRGAQTSKRSIRCSATRRGITVAKTQITNAAAPPPTVDAPARVGYFVEEVGTAVARTVEPLPGKARRSHAPFRVAWLLGSARAQRRLTFERGTAPSLDTLPDAFP